MRNPWVLLLLCAVIAMVLGIDDLHQHTRPVTVVVHTESSPVQMVNPVTPKPTDPIAQKNNGDIFWGGAEAPAPNTDNPEFTENILALARASTRQDRAVRLALTQQLKGKSFALEGNAEDGIGQLRAERVAQHVRRAAIVGQCGDRGVASDDASDVAGADRTRLARPGRETSRCSLAAAGRLLIQAAIESRAWWSRGTERVRPRVP